MENWEVRKALREIILETKYFGREQLEAEEVAAKAWSENLQRSVKTSFTDLNHLEKYHPLNLLTALGFAVGLIRKIFTSSETEIR